MRQNYPVRADYPTWAVEALTVAGVSLDEEEGDEGGDGTSSL